MALESHLSGAFSFILNLPMNQRRLPGDNSDVKRGWIAEGGGGKMGHLWSLLPFTAGFTADTVCRFLFALLLVVRTGDQRLVQQYV